MSYNGIDILDPVFAWLVSLSLCSSFSFCDSVCSVLDGLDDFALYH